MRFRDTLTRSPSGFNSLVSFPANWRATRSGGPTDHLTLPVRCDYSNSRSNRTAPSSSLAQDTCLSRMQHGFESRRGHQLIRSPLALVHILSPRLMTCKDYRRVRRV